KCPGSEKFWQESHAGFKYATMSDDVVGVSRHKEDLRSTVLGGDPASEFAAANAWHHHVGKQEVNLSRAVGGKLFGMSCAFRHQDRIALIVGNRTWELTERRV